MAVRCWYCDREIVPPVEISEAIPPAYTEWIGQHLMALLTEAVA